MNDTNDSNKISHNDIKKNIDLRLLFNYLLKQKNPRNSLNFLTI